MRTETTETCPETTTMVPFSGVYHNADIVQDPGISEASQYAEVSETNLYTARSAVVSKPTLIFNTVASSASVESSVTEVYRDVTPPPNTKHLPSDLFYAMTSLSSSHDSIFLPGTMALAKGQVVHINSSSIDEDTNITSYAVRAGSDVFITTSDTLTAIPLLPAKSISTSSTTTSTHSSRSKQSRSRHTHKNQPRPPVTPPPSFRPVDVVSIPDDTSLGGSTMATRKNTETSPICYNCR